MQTAAELNLEISRGVIFGPLEIHVTNADGTPFPLAGWAAHAQVRKDLDSELVILDFSPEIAADDNAGLITIPKVSHSVTASLPLGSHVWDLVLENPAGDRLPPILSGKIAIGRISTRPA